MHYQTHHLRFDLANIKTTNMLIPNISRQTYNLANQCAIALWNGINYETGKKQLISDSALLQMFAIKTHRNVKYGVPMSYSLNEISILLKVTKLSHHIDPLTVDLSTGKMCLNQTVTSYAMGNNPKGRFFRYQLGAVLSDILGRSFSTKKYVIRNGQRIRTQNNKTTLASRLLFFTVPNLQCFNLNDKVAKSLQLKYKKASLFNEEYCEAFATLLDRDWHILSNFTMPTVTNEISQTIWNEAFNGCWWQRRVLDLAVLLHFNLISATYIRNYFSLAKPKLPPLFKKA